jgi:[ribosomal protein S18]-alanine N-acetyltransferase
MNADDIIVKRLGREDAEAIVGWRHPGAFAVYDVGADALAKLLDPRNRYFGIHRAGELIGHVCLGPEARVPGLAVLEGADDLGIGIRPDLTGRGQARTLLPALLAAIRDHLTQATVRVTIVAWNLRAQAAARAVGFVPDGEVENANSRYVVMTLSLTQIDSDG